MDKKFYVNASFESDSVEKKAGSSSLKIAGYANTVDKDRAGDIVLPSAWAKGIDRFRKNPVLLYQHKHDNPIGRVSKVTVDKKGMFIEASVSEAAEKLHGIHSLIKDGALKSFSVGFLVKDGKHDKSSDTFVISEVELLEISVVSVPANQESLFSVRKSFENSEDYESFKKSFPVASANVEDEKESKEIQASMSTEEKAILENEGPHRIGITTRDMGHYHIFQMGDTDDGMTIYGSDSREHVHQILNGQIQAMEGHTHRILTTAVHSREEDEEEENGNSMYVMSTEESVTTSIVEKNIDKDLEAEEPEEDPYEPIPFVNLLSADTNLLKNGQFVQLDGARYVVTKIATSDSPTFQFKQVDLQGQHLDKILNIDATSLEVLNIWDVGSKFDIQLAEIEELNLDENNKQQIYTQFKSLINSTEKDLYDLKTNDKIENHPSLQEKLNKTINIVSNKTNWTDSDFLVANRICQVIIKLKEIEHSEDSMHGLMLQLHGHLEAQTKEKLNMATQAVDEPVVIGSTAETKTEVTTPVKVAEPRVAELVEKTGEAIVKEADAKDKNGEYTPRETEKAAELQAQIKKYKDEIAALQNSKMLFQEQSRGSQFTQRELANAYLLSKALRKESVFDTKFGARMKAVTTVDQFLSNFSADVYTELQQELVVAKMLRRMSVDAKTFRIPVADEDTDGDVAQFASGTYTTGIADSTNVPTSNQHTIKSVDFTPHKFMATTHLAKDEEEDTILPLLDFLRTASMRRMGRAIDKALLRGDGSLSGFTASPTNAITAGTGYAAVFKGIATLTNDIAGLLVQTGGNSTKAAPTNIASARALLGKYGLQLGDHLVFLTTIEGYNELVSNSDFRTVDKFGPNATYLTGALGAVYGIPVMITEFLDVVGGANRHIGLLVYKPGFLVAERRAMEIESEYDPRRQVTAIYMSTRLDMKALTTNNNAALDATKYSMASLIRSGA